MKEGHIRKSHEHRKDLAGEFRWGDTGQFLLLIVFIVGMFSDLFIFKISISWQNVFPWFFRIIVFIPLLFIAGYFAQRAHRIVFQQVRDELIVIRNDVFSMIRHPMYFGSILVYLGFVILSFSVISLIVFVIVVIFYIYLCRYEEHILIEKLGYQYMSYMKKVPMLIPFIKLK